MSYDDIEATLGRLARENQKLWTLLEFFLTREKGETAHVRRIGIETWSKLTAEIETMAASRTDWVAADFPELFLFAGRKRGQSSRRGKT